MLQKFCAISIRVDIGEITYIVAVALKPAQHRVFGVEEPILIWGPLVVNGRLYVTLEACPDGPS